jgi:hypothetical protein
MVRPGTYLAVVANHAIGETLKGDPQAIVTFSFQTDHGPQVINWYGYFTEKTTPTTLKSLLICGLKGNNPAGPLEIGKEVQIVIENEKDEKGKERSKVRWVNQVGAGVKSIPQDLAKVKLSALEGAVMAARQDMNLTDTNDSDDFGF